LNTVSFGVSLRDHYPTDSTLLGDGVRLLIRTMKKITKIVGTIGTKLRDRSRSVKFRLLEIGRIARAKGAINQDKLKQRYRSLLDTTSRMVGQAKRFSVGLAGLALVDDFGRWFEHAEELAFTARVAAEDAGSGLLHHLPDERHHLVELCPQAFQRQLLEHTRSPLHAFSDFREFGKMVKLQEAENQIIINYEVYGRRPNDSDLLVLAIDTHQAPAKAVMTSHFVRMMFSLIMRVQLHPTNRRPDQSKAAKDRLRSIDPAIRQTDRREPEFARISTSWSSLSNDAKRWREPRGFPDFRMSLRRWKSGNSLKLKLRRNVAAGRDWRAIDKEAPIVGGVRGRSGLAKIIARTLIHWGA
jgi:hypothetical protein